MKFNAVLSESLSFSTAYANKLGHFQFQIGSVLIDLLQNPQKIRFRQKISLGHAKGFSCATVPLALFYS